MLEDSQPLAGLSDPIHTVGKGPEAESNIPYPATPSSSPETSVSYPESEVG